VLAVQADLTVAAEVCSWVRRAEEDLGPVQAMVSCAGITRDRPLTQLTDAEWRVVIDTNLDGGVPPVPGRPARDDGTAVWPDRRGSSVSGVTGDVAGRGPGAADRGSARPQAGIAGFIRALASQTRRYGIRANAVAPSAQVSRTDMTSIWPEGTTAPLTEAIALRRFASAAEAAGRVAFLLSEAAADITGTVVEVPSGIGLPIPAARGAGLALSR
jgi:3-oxoacyl-[acyl-carrier protein] reductase